MSVVTTWEAVPNRIEAVVRYLGERRGVPNDELFELLSPSTLSGTTNVVSRVVQESRELGLIEADDGGRWSVTPTAARAKDLRALVRQVLLTPESAEAAKQQWVAPAIAWFLTHDPREPLALGENWRTRVERECPSADNAFDLANPASCSQFAYWAVYLGFGWRLARSAGEVLVPDPAGALESALRATMQAGEVLPIAEAIERVGAACPVFEGGDVRQAVERSLIPARQRPDGQLSQSTSVALSRLEAQGVVSMPPPLADARVMTLDLWPQRRRVSHLQWNEVAG